LNKELDNRDNDADDEIKPEDGRERYLMFMNGEQVRLLLGLAAAFLFVLWCFIYILGGAQTLLGIALLVVASIMLAVWHALDLHLDSYQANEWSKDRRPPRRRRIEARIALALWLLIFISAGISILLRWRQSH
jgi:hypothetical protein